MAGDHNFYKAAQTGDLTFFKACSKKHGSDTSWLHKSYAKSGDTVLHYSAQFGHVELLGYLIEQGADVEKPNFDGKKPLHDAAQNGHSACVKFLLEKGAMIDGLKRADWFDHTLTPLMLACTKHDLDVIRILVEHGANLNLVNKDGWNPFHIACREGDIQVMKYLLSKDTQSWDTVSKNGRTPLHTAALHGNTEAVSYLLDNCAVVMDTTDSCGSTPFIDALRSGHVDIARILLNRQKVDIHKEDNFGYQTIHLAVQTGQLMSVQFLVEDCSLDVNGRSTKGFFPLAVAAKEGQLSVMQYLVDKGADIDMADNKGRTALHIAAAAQHAECCQYLLQRNAKCSADVNGKTPQDYARKQHVIDVFTTFCAGNETANTQSEVT
ncbi:hypothetical protein FSP39_021966 [Pinctada imbricata]|uniref:Ankyrin repeat domain-containing protein 16 n=1 Tax=Pinctada imbricata TaxID=66713 RepID=A0AA88YMG7_PINIB|nr:hypothetical protein FSP39_021966 [Pinctada imbricata]